MSSSRSLNIVVLAKIVLDSTLVRYDSKRNDLVIKGVPYKINDNDIYALEVADRVKGAFRARITVVSTGPSEGRDVAREAFVRGADEVIYLTIPSVDVEPFTMAQLLAAEIRNHNPDLILCGNVSEDMMYYSTQIYLAEIMKLPVITNTIDIIKVDLDRNTILVKRAREDFFDIYELKLPAIVSIRSGAVMPRIVTPMQILRIPRDKVKAKGLGELGVEPEKLKLGVSIEKLGFAPSKLRERKRQFIDADKEPEKAVKLLLEVLSNYLKL